MNARDYRAHLYQNRAHPKGVGRVDSPTDNSALYFSVLAFLAAEYLVELKLARFPSGLVFPTGFLFFWAFYYTYYQPGHLEKTLSHEQKWDISGIPLTLVRGCIWFVKIMFVEFTEKIISNLVGSKKEIEKTNPSRTRTHYKVYSGKQQRESSYRPQSQAFPNRDSARESQTRLPKEVSNALGIMGIPEARDWTIIQKRYRELAKQYHPDLNPELTQSGNRFMLYDAAYRKLEAVKGRYFIVKK
jgi:DnaJ domain